jgi:hypothetical protein
LGGDAASAATAQTATNSKRICDDVILFFLWMASVFRTAHPAFSVARVFLGNFEFSVGLVVLLACGEPVHPVPLALRAG